MASDVAFEYVSSDSLHHRHLVPRGRLKGVVSTHLRRDANLLSPQVAKAAIEAA
jgi:hypothetical protein